MKRQVWTRFALALAALALIPTVIGHSALMLSLRHLRAQAVGDALA